MQNCFIGNFYTYMPGQFCGYVTWAVVQYCTQKDLVLGGMLQYYYLDVLNTFIF